MLTPEAPERGSSATRWAESAFVFSRTEINRPSLGHGFSKRRVCGPQSAPPHAQAIAASNSVEANVRSSGRVVHPSAAILISIHLMSPT